jgi:hypothetical protein
VKDGKLMVFCGAMIIALPFTHVCYRLSIVHRKFLAAFYEMGKERRREKLNDL